MIHEKITLQHLERKAILYVRQSSAHQVLHNRKGSSLQYAMRDRLAALGCPRHHFLTSERRLEDMKCGALRWSDREQGWKELVPSVAFKNSGSSFFGRSRFASSCRACSTSTNISKPISIGIAAYCSALPPYRWGETNRRSSVPDSYGVYRLKYPLSNGQ